MRRWPAADEPAGEGLAAAEAQPRSRVRSYLIHRLSPLGADAKAIVKRLDEEPDITIRRALILSLGEFGEKDFTPDDRKALLPKLQEMYRTASRSGPSCGGGMAAADSGSRRRG